MIKKCNSRIMFSSNKKIKCYHGVNTATASNNKAFFGDLSESWLVGKTPHGREGESGCMMRV